MKFWGRGWGVTLKSLLRLFRPRSTVRFSQTIRSVATGHQWSGPMKLKDARFHWSVPPVSCSNWTDCRTESEIRAGPVVCPGSGHTVYSESLGLLWLKLGWWCVIMSRSIMKKKKKDWFAKLQVHCHSKDSYWIKTWLFILYLLNCWSFWRKPKSDGTSSRAGLSWEKIAVFKVKISITQHKPLCTRLTNLSVRPSLSQTVHTALWPSFSF